jgi:hypothetical protein
MSILHPLTRLLDGSGSQDGAAALISHVVQRLLSDHRIEFLKNSGGIRFRRSLKGLRRLVRSTLAHMIEEFFERRHVDNLFV